MQWKMYVLFYLQTFFSDFSLQNRIFDHLYDIQFTMYNMTGWEQALVNCEHRLIFCNITLIYFIEICCITHFSQFVLPVVHFHCFWVATPNITVRCFMFLRSWAETAARRVSILIWDMLGFITPFQASVRIISEMRVHPLPSAPFPGHYSLVSLPFNALQSEL
jgi:hypothetical protein